MPVLSTKHLFCPPDLISFSPNHATGKHKSIFVKLITVEDIYFVFIIYILIMQKKAQTKKALILANNDRDLGAAWNHRWNWTVLLQPMSNGTKRLQKSKGHYWSHVISDVSIIFKQNSINQANSLYLKRPRAPEIHASQCNWLILSYCRQFYITASKWLWTITLDAWHSMSLLFLSTYRIIMRNISLIFILCYTSQKTFTLYKSGKNPTFMCDRFTVI